MRFSSIISAASFSLLAGCAVLPEKSTVTGEYLAGRLAARVNSIDQAAAAYAGAHADAPQQVAILRDAFFYNVASGNIDAAAPYAKALIEPGVDSDDGLAKAVLAAHAIKHGNLKEARAYLTGEVDAPFLKSVAFLANAWVEAGISGQEAAVAKLETAGDDMFKGFLPLHQAFLLEQLGRNEEARSAYQVAIFSFGGPVGRAAYGAFLERIGDDAAAQEYYKLLSSEPGPTRRAAEQGLQRLQSGAPSQAYANIDTTKGAAIAFYSFGGAILEQVAGERARASDAGFNVGAPQYNLPLALTQLALYLNPELVEARRLAASIFNIYGDYETAAEILSQIPPSSPHFEQARIEIASGLSLREREDEAIALLKETIRRDKGAIEARLTLANIYAQHDQHENAVEAVSAAIDQLGETPVDDSWRFFITRGASLIEIDRWKDAERDLKRAVEIAPEEATALNYLGYSWAERGENLEEAFALIEKAVELQPKSGAIIDSLGWAYYQRGQYDEAVGPLEKAAALEPADPTITDHLGDVYWRLGRPLEARYQWQRALELEPKKKTAAAIKKKLKNGLEDQSTDDKKNKSPEGAGDDE